MLLGDVPFTSFKKTYTKAFLYAIIGNIPDWQLFFENSISFSDVIGQGNIKAVSMIWKYLDLIMRTDRLCYALNENEKFQICSNLCPLCGGQEVIVLHWDNLSDCYRRPRDRGMFDANGLFVFQRFSPADRAGLEKMDYVWTVNNNEVITGKYL